MTRGRRRIGRDACTAALAACCLAGVVACSPEPDGVTPAGLADTAWTVTTINGGGVIPNAPPTITFSTDKQVSGSTGCNQYSALFSTDGNRITIGVLTATEIGCDGARSTQEQVFLKGLDGATTWHVTETGALEIGGQVTLVAEPGIAAGIPVPSPGASIVANDLAALADAKGWGIGGDGRWSVGGFHLMRFAAR